MTSVATTTERTARLQALESVIDQHVDGFIAMARAMTAIRDEGLYSDAGYSSFDDYLQQRWKRAMSYRVMQSAAALLELSTVVDGEKLTVIHNQSQALALAHVIPALQPAVIELLNSTIVDKPTASRIGKLGKVLEGVLEELKATGTISVTEEDQLPAAAIPTITAAVLLELREANYRQLQHLTDLQAKREPCYEATGRADDLLTWRILGAQTHLTEQNVTVKVFENRNGYTIRVERNEQ